MRIAARAPGKLAVLGEYAVLRGAPALVLAVDRLCVAEIAPSTTGECRLETRAPAPRETRVREPGMSGVPLVDRVLEAWPAPAGAPAWRATLDSSAFHLDGTKLGIGSSAAALVAFAGAWTAWLGVPAPSLRRLVELHRRFQGGAGSGFDIAASLVGGSIQFRLDRDSLPIVGSVRMPNSVGFASIFAGRSASTPDFVARFEAFERDRPKEAEERQLVMTGIAEQGCAAVREGDGPALLRAVEGYGGQLEQLGRDIGADIVTAEHRAIGEIARRFGVAYKVSGAGGGDLGVGLGNDPDALAAFGRAVSKNGYKALNLHQSADGLAVEELAE
jgi:phosphomevalonate kinase